MHGRTAWPRGAMLVTAIAVVVFLAWRVLIAGNKELAEQNALKSLQLDAVPADTVAAEAALRKRLARNPADATALIALALELETQQRREESTAAMRTGMRLAPADPLTLLVAAEYYLRAGDEAQALAILRRAVDSSERGLVGHRVWPLFSAALDTGRHPEFFDGLARDNPPWWPGFFRYICERGTNLTAVYAAHSSRVAANVATRDETQCLIDRLQRIGQWRQAYQVWLNGLPLEQRQRVGYVFNGGFEWALSNQGFDWRIPAQGAAVVSAEPVSGMSGQHALSVAFVNQRYAGPPIEQHLMLFPGRYLIEGRARSDLEAWLGFQWGIYCREATGATSRQLAQTASISGVTSWREFGQEFVVPQDCPVQLLRLELAKTRPDGGSAGNVAIRLKGTAWFDDLRVRIID